MHKLLCKIRNNEYIREMIKELEFEDFVNDDFFIIDMVRIRVLELFKYVYKIYCIDKSYIDSLKNGSKGKNNQENKTNVCRRKP